MHVVSKVISRLDFATPTSLVPSKAGSIGSISMRKFLERDRGVFTAQTGIIGDSDFLNNTATAGQGGAVYLQTGLVDVVNCRCETRRACPPLFRL